ncbi:rhodanese-like domain-containing protein [Sulfolobales archaeon HS-7]|nr:rhodanese-like domain-containing protein [Sulfolobales archaeon HS-7]
MKISEYRMPYLRNVIDEYPSTVRRMYRRGEVMIVDIRTIEEYLDHHIPGSILIPMEFVEDFANILADKEVVIACEHGNRSYYLTRTKSNLFRKCYNMLGGIDLWMRIGYEIASGKDKGLEMLLSYLEGT